MVIDLNRNSPLRIVNIGKVWVLGCNGGDFFQNFFIVEFVIVSAFEIQHPAFYLTSLAVDVHEFLDCIKHAKMFSLECSFNRQYSMAISRHLSSFLVHIFHYLVDNYQGIYLSVLWVYFYENQTLNHKTNTFTFVSIWLSNLFCFCFWYLISFSRVTYLPSCFIFFRIFSSVTSL